MKNAVLGAFAVMAMLAVGLFWWQGRAEAERGAPPPVALETEPAADILPISDAGTSVGPAPPEATELSREERRFFTYDRNRDRRITRNEMLATRTAAFRKLDTDGNNLLTFEEWAIATGNKFKAADRDGNLELSPAEFATTRPKQARKPACRC